MQYSICIRQEGGVRPYNGQSFSISSGAPIAPIDVPVQKFLPVVSQLLARVLGWEYFKSAHLSEGSVGVEIGVDFGDGAARWLESSISKLHLVDPWIQQDVDHWTAQDQELMDQRFEFVKKRFKDEPRVEIHRQLSSDFFKTLHDNSIDWVFIDGDHSTEGAYSDLIDSFRVVKPGGIIAGDDMHGCSRWAAEVRVAYERFMSEYGDRVELIWDQYAPFILRKKVA